MTTRTHTQISVETKSGSMIQVEAVLLGGEEGVFGVCRDPNRYEECWLLGGDDGAWWVIGVYHQDWMPGIISTLRNV